MPFHERRQQEGAVELHDRTVEPAGLRADGHDAPVLADQVGPVAFRERDVAEDEPVGGAHGRIIRHPAPPVTSDLGRTRRSRATDARGRPPRYVQPV